MARERAAARAVPLAVRYEVTRDWDYEERKRRIALAYAWLLGIAAWPEDDQWQRAQERAGRRSDDGANREG